MGNQLVNLYRNVRPDNPLSVSSTPIPGGGNYNPQTQTETLPYGGGSFNPGGGGAITPAPIFTGAPTTPESPTTPSGLNYDKYKDPKTGKIMSPVEYANYLASKIPKGSGQISNYAGDAMTNPNQTSDQLTRTATGLNNARNDIASGTTDPYKVGSQSGIAYSPTELAAIEKAYAGVYDPALKDVFSRLKDKQTEDKALADETASMKARVFSTNESIRLWQATTGTGKSYNGSGDGVNDDDIYNFSDTQLNKGAASAGMNRATFDAIESGAIKNYWVNPPKVQGVNKVITLQQSIAADIEKIKKGELTTDEVGEKIMSTSIPSEVKVWLINTLPEEDEVKKEAWIKKALRWVGDIVN